MMRALPILFLALLLAGCSATKGLHVGADAGEKAVSKKDKQAKVLRLYLNATNARLMGNTAKAVQLYKEVTKADPQNGAAMFELAKLYHQGRQNADALAMAKDAVQADDNNIWYRFLLAELSNQEGDLTAVAQTYRDILKRWPDRYEVYFGLADVLYRQGKLNDARKVYRDLEQRTGPSEELVMQEYNMLVDAGQIKEAKNLLEEAIGKEPANPRYVGMLAELYQELGQNDQALEMYHRAIELDPDDSMIRISLAQFLYDQGKLQEGFEQLREAFADPDLDIDPKMQLMLGFFRITQHAEPDSIREQLVQQSHQLIQTMKKAHPRSGKPSAIEGDFLMREGRSEEARDAFREALEFEKDKFPIWAALLQLDFELEDWPALHADASAASALFPTQPELLLYDGLALYQEKRYEEAIDALVAGRDLVVDNPPMEAQFNTLLGDAYNAVGDHAASDMAYAKALKEDADNAGVLNNWAYHLSVRGEKLEKAEEMSRRSNELAPDTPTFMDTYAWVLYKMGRFAEAKEWQEKALKLEPHPDGVLLEHYGDILYKLNDTAGALEQWKKAQAAGNASELIDRKVSEGVMVE